MQKTPLLRLATLIAIAAAASLAPSLAPAAETPDTASSVLPASSIASLSGAYLAAKSAQAEGNLDAATDYYAQALLIDPTSVLLQQDAMFAFLAAGKFKPGVELAAKLRDSADGGKVARIALGLDLIRRGKFEAATAELDILNPSNLDALLICHLSAWADAGAGHVDQALARIRELGGAEWYPVFNAYQSGLIASYAGRSEEARKFFKSVVDVKDNAQTSPDVYLASAAALARLEARAGKKAAALAAVQRGLDLAENYDPLKQLKTKIDKGETIEPAITEVNEGAAETLYVLGQAVNRGDGQQVAVLYFQLARAMAPSDPSLLTALAGIAERNSRLPEAIGYYEQIPQNAALRRTADLQMGLDLWYAGRKDEAKRHLHDAVANYPDDLQAFTALADILAADKDFAGAASALDKAVTLAAGSKQESWNLYYQRGIARERLKEWEKAEPDFRKALQLAPNQPQVLNYLGYSWVDMNENLDEGLGMIKTAVDLRPNDGYIIDSLGWAYFRLARYDDAVEQLERAVLINPVDPTINDHLGDAYWRVGRTREARFQWSRALGGDPKPEAADIGKISEKLKEGLPADSRKAEMPNGAPTKATVPAKLKEADAAAPSKTAKPAGPTAN